jgi:hypothetical protein
MLIFGNKWGISFGRSGQAFESGEPAVGSVPRVVFALASVLMDIESQNLFGSSTIKRDHRAIVRLYSEIRELLRGQGFSAMPDAVSDSEDSLLIQTILMPTALGGAN